MDRNSRLKVFLIAVLGILFILNSCLPKKEQAPYPYKIELNPLRKEIGLRIIDSTFYKGPYGFESVSTFDKVNDLYYDSYMKPKDRDRKPKTQSLYWEKHTKLNRDNGKPQYEQDIYRSGFYKYGHIEETDIFETLKFRYVFEDYNYYDFKTKDSLTVSKGWEYIYEYPIEITNVTSNKSEKNKNGYWKRKTKQINKKQADSILKAWKLKKINY